MFSAVLTIKSMDSFVHTVRIFFIPHFMIFIAYVCIKDHFKLYKYTEFDYTAHKIVALFILLVSMCYQSVEQMLHVKRQIKNSQKLCCVFSHGVGKTRELKQNTPTVIDSSRFLMLCFLFAAVDTTKDPCQNVKCSRHKVCVAQGYQRAMCVNRKKLEHR